jgi:DnaJ family protein B protein 12
MFGGGGSQFVFNLGGGPGFRVHQFGGGRPRRRPREANDAEQRPQSLTTIFTNLLPLIILFVLPLLSSLFSSSDSTSSGPDVRYEAEAPFTTRRTTPRWHFEYYVNPAEVADYSPNSLHSLDKRVELNYMRTLQYNCANERQTQQRLVQEAQGWFFQDTDKMMQARSLEMQSCRRLRELGVQLESYY